MFLVPLHDGIWEYLAYSPLVIPPLLQRFGHESIDDKIHEAVNAFIRRLSESPDKRFLKYAYLYVGPRSTLVLSRAHHTDV